MSTNCFEHMLSIVGPVISKKNTRMRKNVSTAERLAVTLPFVATDDAQQSLSYHNHLGKATASNIISQTYRNSCPENEYLDSPKSKEEWLEISKKFEETWNIIHAIGVTDCKQIHIYCPKLMGTQFYKVILEWFS